MGPTHTSTNSQPNFNSLILSWLVMLTAKLTGDKPESPTECNALELTESTADAWEIPAVHLSSLTQMMVSLTWSETLLSVPQTAAQRPQECGPRTSLSRTGSKISSLPNLFIAIFYRIILFYISIKTD